MLKAHLDEKPVHAASAPVCSFACRLALQQLAFLPLTLNTDAAACCEKMNKVIYSLQPQEYFDMLKEQLYQRGPHQTSEDSQGCCLTL